MKRVIFYLPGGGERVLDKPPSWSEMRSLIGGGLLEQVSVLDHIEPPRNFVYTYMFVDEEGLLKRMPRNDKATAIYQRNVRAMYPRASNPFAAAQQEFRRQVKASGAVLIENPNTPAGFNDDPHICGPAVFWEGYTCEEIVRMLNGEDDDE